MKKNLFFVALAAMALVACDKEDAPAAPEGSVKFADEVIAWDGMQTTAEINANCAWKITSKSEYLSVKPSEGNADTKMVEITISANHTNESQTLPFDVELTGANGEKKTLQESIILPAPFLTLGDVTYKVVYMADGNYWLAENLRYVPAGAKVGDPSDADAKIYYPGVLQSIDGGYAVEASQDPAVIAAQGLLYTPEFVLGQIPEQDSLDITAPSAICPEGWHIPTAKEWIGLVGACNFAAWKNVNAPYYDATTLSGGDMVAMNEDGFNVQPYSYVSKGAYFKTVQNQTAGSDWAGMVSMSGYLSSTTHQTKSAMQVFGGSIMNLKAKTYMTVGYFNLTDALYVRLIKD